MKPASSTTRSRRSSSSSSKTPSPGSQTPAAPNEPPELDRFRIRQLIEEDNPGAKVDDVELYTHQFLTYLEAAENILRNGTIVAHPRTGAPMENPCVKVRATAQGQLKKIKRLWNLDRVWLEARRFLDGITYAARPRLSQSVAVTLA